MSDIFSKDHRSKIMSKISGKETKPEIIVRKYLFANGFRYLKNVKTLPSKPDIVLPKYKTIIFVHGCFWHGHDCKAGKLPEIKKEFWTTKITRNIERDKENIKLLSENKWKVIVIWQCEIKNVLSKNKRLMNLIKEIKTSME